MSDGHTTARSPSPAGPDVPPPSRRRRRSQLNVLLHEIEQLPGAKADRCVDKPMVERVFAASSAAAAAPPPDDPATPEHLLSPPTAKPAPPPASHFAVVRARVRRLSYFKPARSRAILAGADDGALPPPGVMQRDPSSEPSRNLPAGAPPSVELSRTGRLLGRKGKVGRPPTTATAAPPPLLPLLPLPLLPPPPLPPRHHHRRRPLDSTSFSACSRRPTRAPSPSRTRTGPCLST